MSTLTEFFVPDHLRPRPVDSEGYELPPWENPYFQIPDQVEPSPINDALFVAELADWFSTAPEPSEADIAWLNTHPSLPPIAGGSPEPFEPSDADWDDYARFCEDVERSNALRRMEDAEYEARCRFG